MKTSFAMDTAPLQAYLDQLAAAGPSIARRAVGAGASAAARAMRNAATTATVRKSIGWRFAKASGRVRAIVGINVGKGPTKQTRWAAAQVLGTKPRYRKTRSGQRAYTGTLQPNQAVGRAVSAAQSQISGSMSRSIEANLKKLGDK